MNGHERPEIFDPIEDDEETPVESIGKRSVVVKLDLATLDEINQMLDPHCAMCGKVLFGARSLVEECTCSARCRNCLSLFCRNPYCQMALDGAFDDGPEDWTKERD